MSCRQNKVWHYFHLFCGSWTQKRSPSASAEESPHLTSPLLSVYLKAGSLGSDDHPAGLEWDLGFVFHEDFPRASDLQVELVVDSGLPTLGSRIT